MDNYITICNINGFGEHGYKIRATYEGQEVTSWKYYGYSKREAIRLYRERFGLKYKKLLKVEY